MPTSIQVTCGHDGKLGSHNTLVCPPMNVWRAFTIHIMVPELERYFATSRPHVTLPAHLLVQLSCTHATVHRQHAEGGESDAHQALAEDHVEVSHPRASRREVHDDQRVHDADQVLRSAARAAQERVEILMCPGVQARGALKDNAAARRGRQQAVSPAQARLLFMTTDFGKMKQPALPSSRAMLKPHASRRQRRCTLPPPQAAQGTHMHLDMRVACGSPVACSCPAGAACLPTGGWPLRRGHGSWSCGARWQGTPTPWRGPALDSGDARRCEAH